MARSKSRPSTIDTTASSVEKERFKIGDQVLSHSPVFPSVICTISALPSSDAAIVSLENGTRERLLLKYLEPLLDSSDLPNTHNPNLDNNLDNNYATKFVLIEPLSPDEERERHRLELRVERAFYECGCALRDLRDKRLYRSTHKTFEQYCADRFGFARRHSYQLIDAAAVVENLCANGAQVLPSSERQVRPLAKLESESQKQVWQQAVDEADGKVPTGKIVKGIVEQLKEKPLYLTTDFCSLGDVFTLIRLEGEGRKYNGYPCVAIELKHFTIDVELYDTILAMKPENLKKIDSPDVRRQLPAMIKRIKRLRQYNLDRSAYPILELLGKRTYLTDFESKLLTLMEQEYGTKPNS